MMPTFTKPRQAPTLPTAPTERGKQITAILEILLSGQWPTPDQIDYLRDTYRETIDRLTIRLPSKSGPPPEPWTEDWVGIKEQLTRAIECIGELTTLEMFHWQQLDFRIYEPAVWTMLNVRATMAPRNRGKQRGVAIAPFSVSDDFQLITFLDGTNEVVPEIAGRMLAALLHHFAAGPLTVADAQDFDPLLESKRWDRHLLDVVSDRIKTHLHCSKVGCQIVI